MHYDDDRKEKAYKNRKARLLRERIFVILGSLAVYAGALTFLLWTPIMGPWQQGRIGMANKRQAANENQIIVAEAQGELDAAQFQADAIRTMGEAARKYPEYRTQIYTESLSMALTNGTISEVIFVPQDADLPVTEANRFQQD